MVSNNDRFYLFIVVLLSVVAFLTSMKFATNIPYFDDYNLVLQFLTEYTEADGFLEKLLLITEEQNDHRIVSYRLIAVLDKWIFGSVHFKHFILISNLVLAGIVFYFLRIGQSLGYSLKLLLPGILLLTIPEWAVINWSSTGLASLLMVFFCVSTIYHLNRNSTTSYLVAMTTAFAATFTAAGGFLVFIAAIPLIMEKDKRHRTIWFMTALAAGFLYYLGFESGSKPVSVTSMLLSSPHVVVGNIVLFFGAPFKAIYGDQHVGGLLFGLAVIGISGMLAYRMRDLRKEPLLLSGIIFFFGLAVLISIARSPFGLGATTSYRYRLLQVLPLLMAYLATLKFWYGTMTRLLPAFLTFALIFYGLRFSDNLDQLKFLRERLVAGVINYQLTGEAGQLCFRVPQQAGPILEDAAQNQIYRLPPVLHDLKPNNGLKKKQELEPMTVSIESEAYKDDYIQVIGWAYLKFREYDHLDLYGILKRGSETTYLKAGPYVDPSAFTEINPHAFILNVPRSLMGDQMKPAGIALYHPIKGIVGEYWFDDQVD